MKIRNPRAEIRGPKTGGERNCHFGFGISDWLRISPLLFAASAGVQAADKIPDLKPPLRELPPTFWEQHAGACAGAAVALLAGAAFLSWWLGRPKPAVVTPPAVLARQALESLRGRTEDEPLLRQVSGVLRHYFVAACALEQEEPTVEELVAALNGARRLSAELVAALGGFLRDCDARKFAPTPPPSQFDAIARALELVARCEIELRPVPALAAVPTVSAAP